MPAPRLTEKNIISEFQKKDFEQRNEFKDCWCYVVSNQSLFKIGMTNDVDRRIRLLTTQSGIVIKDALGIHLNIDRDPDAKYLESFLHSYFKEKRKIGEWFDLTNFDLVEIQNLFDHIEGQDGWNYLGDFFDC